MAKNQDFELLKPVITSPQRPRHQVKRSITELSSPIKLPRYHHLHHLHQRKDRDNDDHHSLSAGPMLHLPRGSAELPRSEGTTPYATSETNLRMGLLNPASEDAPQLPVAKTEELLREQKEKAASKIAGLRKSLLELSTFSSDTTRRLDDTYYAVLEKLNMLQGTIIDLKELASMSQELDENFKTESQELVNELEQQADSFGQFNDQQRRIEDLQGRIHAGHEKVEGLSKRVDVVRDRIESWERADLEWQERTRRRLKIIWIVTSVLLLSLVLLLIGAQYAPSSEDTAALADLASGNGGKPDLGNITGNRSVVVTAMVDEVREVLNSRRGHRPVEEEVFRAFDEL